MLSSFWSDFLQVQDEDPKKNKILISILKETKPLDMTEEKIILGCDNIGSKLFLEKRKGEIEELLKIHIGKNLAIGFIVQESKKKKVDAPLFTFEPSKEDYYVRAGLNPKYKFENFAVSSSNQVAFAAAQAVAQNPGSSYNPLFLYGGVGVGKTHLAQAIARSLLEDSSEKRVFFCPGDQFTNELIESIREKSTQKFRKKYRQLNLIIVDDIQFIAGKQTVQEEFFHTFNNIVSAGGQVVLTSDRPPIEIKNLEDRLRSRFSGGLIVDVQSPDFELRTAILLIKAKEKNIEIQMSAARAISEMISDTRALEGALLSIYAKILGKKEVIDLEVVDEYFQEKTVRVAKRVSPTDVIRAVCSFYNVKQAHIKSSTRSSEVAMARQIVMYLLRIEFQLKFEDIAHILKRKDHTTIMHGTDKVKRMMMKDTNFKGEIDSIISSFRAST